MLKGMLFKCKKGFRERDRMRTESAASPRRRKSEIRRGGEKESGCSEREREREMY
jgi:hypothetical protein